MSPRLVRSSLILSACSAALVLGGCGGGGSTGGPGPAPIQVAPPAPPTPPAPPPPPPPPAPAPAPVPPPAPTPAGINYNDAEYSRSNGASVAGAIAAWNAGSTGKGIKVGVIDSGINPNLPEFTGRIDPASRDVVASRGLVDAEGHGTAVSAVIAANRNGAHNVGLAFESTIISLNTSDPNDCDPDDGCQHSDADIARAIDIAIGAKARVINISLGGDEISSTMTAAVRRAAAAGVMIVLSAGNEGEADPGSFATGSAQAGNGYVIIAGAMDSTRELAGFSNRAGSAANFYLTALGSRVRTVDHEGIGSLYSGTSFSAPVISGAAALLAGAFPNLTGKQIVDILFASADDAGSAGVDSTYGRGILNIARAFQPIGTVSVAGSGAPIPAGDGGTTATPMGDAAEVAPEMSGVIILDGYSRAFAADFARSLSRAPVEHPLGLALNADQRTAAAMAGKTAVSITVGERRTGQAGVGLAQLGLTFEDGRKAKLLSGLALSRISPRTAIALGFSESGKTLQQHLSGQAGNAFLVARDPSSRMGFYGDEATSAGIRRDFGSFAVTATGERGEVYVPGPGFGQRQPSYRIGSLTLDRRIGPAALSLAATRLQEEETVLGGRFSTLFGSGGSTSHFVDAAASIDLGRGWGGYASYRRGRTSLPIGGLAEGGSIGTDAWAFDISKRSLIIGGDRFALRLMQPLRVRSGGYALSVPVSYDYETLSTGFEQRFMNLSPNGREVDLEAAWSTPLLDGAGSFGANAFIRRQPGHIAAMDSDLGAAIRFTLGF
jgi:subtilisin family serine protease